MMTIEAAVTGELEGGSSGMELVVLSRNGEFASPPGFEVRLQFFRGTPMRRQISKLRFKLEGQSRVTGGNQVVIDVAGISGSRLWANVALRAGGRSDGEVRQIAHV